VRDDGAGAAGTLCVAAGLGGGTTRTIWRVSKALLCKGVLLASTNHCGVPASNQMCKTNTKATKPTASRRRKLA
jgi:hypothetical protein